jgi:riboflavin kinase/FMN adenylyltransferase
MPPVLNDREIISSSRIRTALANGDVGYAQKFLGRPYRLSGMVVPGDGRGKSLGIPTANIDVWKEQALPASGVYACRAFMDDIPHKAVVNIGFRPTFESHTNEPTIEAHILNFNQDIYKKHLTLDFIDRIRAEIKFASIDALVEQINQDINKALSIL